MTAFTETLYRAQRILLGDHAIHQRLACAWEQVLARPVEAYPPPVRERYLTLKLAVERATFFDVEYPLDSLSEREALRLGRCLLALTAETARCLRLT